jgi:hypothetical protein
MCPLNFEMLCSQGEVAAFLNLTRSRWPNKSEIVAAFVSGEQTFQETLPVLEGGMRLRLSPTATQWLISALQEGREVVILIEGIEEKLRPESFSSHFEQLTAKRFSWMNLIKGPV